MSDDLKRIEGVFAEGRTAEALGLLREYISRNPDEPRALRALGVVLHSTGDQDEAQAALERSVELAPGDIDSGLSLASLFLARDDVPAALKLLRAFLAERPDEPRAWNFLAKLEKLCGRRNSALECLQRSLELDESQEGLPAAIESLKAEAAPEPLYGRRRLLRLNEPGLGWFASQLGESLHTRLDIEELESNNLSIIREAISRHDIIWVEWGNYQAVAITRQFQDILAGRRVILRIHSYEVMSYPDMAYKVDYTVVSDLVFVSSFVRDYFLALYKGPEPARTHVIHNGIDLDRFPFRPGRGRKKIAFVGSLGYKKDPMVMLHAFWFLRGKHPELELHLAGALDGARYGLAMPHMIGHNDLNGCVHKYGQVDDIPGWLADKDYIICTSPFESQGVGLLEAMHSGLRPLIYFFPGADRIYPRAWLWKNFDELEKLLFEGPSPHECAAFVERHYDMRRQAVNFYKMIAGGTQVAEPDPASV